jgi:ketosteroid isomerase-like protein
VSEENVELHRRFVEAFNARDVDGLIALCDQHVEFHSLFAAVGDSAYHGQAIRRWHRDLQEAWGEEIRIEPEAFFDLDEHTLAFNVLHGRGRQSGVEVTMPYAQVIRWREGLIVHFKAYVHREDALRELASRSRRSSRSPRDRADLLDHRETLKAAGLSA